jgi:hypothetical protein
MNVAKQHLRQKIPPKHPPQKMTGGHWSFFQKNVSKFTLSFSINSQFGKLLQGYNASFNYTPIKDTPYKSRTRFIG